jgi:hypothetical protein
VILEKDFSWATKLSYDTEYYCDEYGCNEERICRCSVISNAQVTGVRFSDLNKEIFDEYRDNSTITKRNNKLNSLLHNITYNIDWYTVNRILVANKLFLPQSWNINVFNGYYGQEIGEVTIEPELSIKIDTEVNNALEILDLQKRIEYLLTIEYGGVLPELKNCKWEEIEIDSDKIYYGNTRHRDNVLSKELDYYSDSQYKGIRGIVINKFGGYQVIDGYHRCLSTKLSTVKVLRASKY